MTTIAYKDGVLVADSQCSDEGYLSRTYMDKIARCKDGLCGAAGGAWAGNMFMAWKQGKATKSDFHTKLDVEDDFLGILIRWDGTIELYNRYLIPEYVTGRFYAIGSGAKIALPMMDYGTTAMDAVIYACKYDLYSGGKINQLLLQE